MPLDYRLWGRFSYRRAGGGTDEKILGTVSSFESRVNSRLQTPRLETDMLRTKHIVAEAYHRFQILESSWRFLLLRIFNQKFFSRLSGLCRKSPGGLWEFSSTGL